MEKLKILNRIKEPYENENINIIEYLIALDGNSLNKIKDIMISYDSQAGTYVEWYKNNSNATSKSNALVKN